MAGFFSKSDEQLANETNDFVYHNGVVNQAIDLVFLLRHYDYVLSLNIAPDPKFLKEFILAHSAKKDDNNSSEDPLQMLANNDNTKVHQDLAKYQHLQLMRWLVKLGTYDKIKPFLEQEQPDLSTSQAALQALRGEIENYITQYGDEYQFTASQGDASWDAISFKLYKIAEERDYYDVTYDLTGTRNRINHWHENGAILLFATVAITLVVMATLGIMADYGAFSFLFYMCALCASVVPYAKINYKHEGIIDSAEQAHDAFEGMHPEAAHHKMAVIAFFAAFFILSFNMSAMLAGQAFAITMVTLTLLALISVAAYEYKSTQHQNQMTRTLSREKWIAKKVDEISQDKIESAKSDRYHHHARAMFLNACDEGVSEADLDCNNNKNTLLYRYARYQEALNSQKDSFDYEVISQYNFYQANSFVNEALDFVNIVMKLTTREALEAWRNSRLDAADEASSKDNNSALFTAYIKWFSNNASLYLKDRNNQVVLPTHDQVSLLMKTDPTADECKRLDELRMNYPQYHLLKACAQLDLECKDKKITKIEAFHAEVQQRVLAALTPVLNKYVGASYQPKTLESLHLALKNAQHEYGYWSLATIPSHCKALDYKSAMNLAALGLGVAIAMAASLMYADLSGSAFRVGWMGYAIACAGIATITAMECDDIQKKKMLVKDVHMNNDSVYQGLPKKAGMSL